MCMHAQEVLFLSNKIYKKPVTFFKNGCKKFVYITKCNEKNCLKRITLHKKLSASPKNGNPPPPIKSNGPSLIVSWGQLCPSKIIATSISYSAKVCTLPLWSIYKVFCYFHANSNHWLNCLKQFE